ncbi:recombinase family protein [Acutalibacter muris]|uniref:recombinase family protein n=1 Tax=Acutalibacter muris TaxID=1796620 RepID=UPI00272DFFD4|nr:recombinase family protein [Acutalibacter muris]
MSLRYIPYGYKFENGRPVPHPDESRTVQEIFTRYCAGESLKALADDLTQRQVEYIPGKTDWNKARIKRILENSRYAGEGEYPAIIEKEQFVAANLMKDSANKCKATVGPEIKLFKEFMVCADCGLPLKRRVDSRFAESVSWKCEKCGWAVKLGDDALKARVIHLMNRLVTEPQLAQVDEPPQEVYSLEGKRLLNEFHRAMDNHASEEELLEMVLQIVAEKYTALADAPAITARLVADFGKAQRKSTFQKEIFLRTVRHIRLNVDGKIALELQNGKIIEEGSAST